MGDVVENYPSILPTYEDKADLGSLPEYASENKALAAEWDAITGVLSALARAVRLTAQVAAKANPTVGINGKAFRFTGQDAAGLGTISTSMATDPDKAFAAGVEKIAEGGSLSGTLSASAFFGVGDGLLSSLSGTFSTGALLAFNDTGGLTGYLSASKLPPIARAINATTNYVFVGGRIQADGSTIEFDANGKLRLKTGGNGIFDDLTVRERFETQETTVAQFTADQNNFNVPEATFVRLSTDATRTITGISNTADGRQLILTNIGSFDLILAHENAGSSAANRINVPNDADLTLGPDDSALLIYDSITTRWRIKASSTMQSAIRTPLRNETGGVLAKGTIVATSGFSVPEGRPLVVVADKDDAAKRPGLAVTETSIADNTNFDGLVLGLLTGLNTSAFLANDQLVLGDAGAVSRPPPEVDPFTGEIQLVGSTVRIDASNGSIYFTLSSGLLPLTAAEFFAVRETSPTGSVSGGEVTRAAGLNVDVAAGSGFVNDDTDVFRVTWSAVTNLALTASDTNFIFVDKNGVVQDSVSPPTLGDNIVLADAITNATTVLLLANHRVVLKERPAATHDYVRDVVGNIVVSGVITAKDAIALRLEVEAGTFYTRDFRVTVPATDPITFTYWFRDGSGGFTRVAGSTLIDKDNFDDGSGTLAALVATEFKKDLLFVVFTATGAVEYHVFYGQEKFTSQAEAESGNLPAVDGDVIANGVQSGGIVIEGASATIASVVDVRPFLGQLGPGTTAVTDHGLLSGLGDAADHLYAMLLDGTRAMTGALDMGTNAIANVGNVDGVDVSSHAGRHPRGGADEIDGDTLDIDFTPANYTPDVTPPEVTNVDELTSHLKGIDDALATAGEARRNQFFADQLDNPVTADWAVNALAPATADSNNDGLTVRLFDDTTEEGVGFSLFIPSGKTNIKFMFVSRAETAPGATKTVKIRIYERGIPDNAAVDAWSAANAMADISIPINENFQVDTETKTLASLGLTANQLHQFEFTRNAADAGDDLVGDWALKLLQVEFT